jgi:hypothetical protein
MSKLRIALMAALLYSPLAFSASFLDQLNQAMKQQASKQHTASAQGVPSPATQQNNTGVAAPTSAPANDEGQAYHSLDTLSRQAGLDGHTDAKAQADELAAEKAAAPGNVPVWTDPQTGLMWARCPLGLSWDAGSAKCGGVSSLSITWDEAIMRARQATLYGYTDWRVPTAPELSTVYYGHSHTASCPGERVVDLVSKEGKYDVGCGAPRPVYGVFDGNFEWHRIWTSTIKQQEPLQVVRLQDRDFGVYAVHPLAFGGSPITGEMYLVRAGTPNGVFDDAVALAQRDLNAVATQQQAQAAKAQQAQDQAQQQQQVWAKQLAAFRAKIQVGDKVAQGLVLEIKGNLINVQTYERQCVAYSEHINPFSGDHDCMQFQMVASGQQWFNRKDIMPAR